MKKYIIHLLALVFCYSISSAQVLESGNRGTTRAVVIGISDYEFVDDLQFAHRDAEAFAEYLKSRGGGNIPENQIVLLTNDEATFGEISQKLDWLVEKSEENDEAIIFFSGHGDIEANSYRKEGFLLCYNSPPFSYRTSAFAVHFLRDIVETLTFLKKSKVILITDACRSGKLAGSEIGGSKKTTAALLEQFNNEIKILSCQPTEFSIEGVQWGGGHGAFSYNLIEGLYGNADSDNNQRVKVKEIGRYLEDRVPWETDPHVQNPIVIGDREDLLSFVDEELYAKRQEEKPKRPDVFSPGNMRGMEDLILVKSDSVIQQAYNAFMAALEAGNLMFPEDSSANTYFEILIREKSIADLHGFLKRRFVAALIDDAQKALNGWLMSDPKEVNYWSTARAINQLKFPAYLEKATEILGELHYLYNDLKAKEYFFKARSLVLIKGGDSGDWDSTSLTLLYDYVEKGLSYDDQAPYLHAKRSYYFAYKGEWQNLNKSDRKVTELAPTWIQAKLWLAGSYQLIGQSGKAQKLREEVILKDSNNLNCWNSLALFYEGDHQVEKLRLARGHIIDILETNEAYQNLTLLRANTHLSLGNFSVAESMYKAYLKEVDQALEDASINHEVMNFKIAQTYHEIGMINLLQEHFEEVEEWYYKGLAIDSTSVPASRSYIGLSIIMNQRKDFQKRDFYLEKSKNISKKINFECYLFLLDHNEVKRLIWLFSEMIELFPDYFYLYYHLARIHIEQKNDYEKGIPLLEKAIQLDPGHAYAHYHLALAHAQQGKTKPALNYLEQALEKGYDDQEKILSETTFEKLRKTRRFKRFMKQYFNN